MKPILLFMLILTSMACKKLPQETKTNKSNTETMQIEKIRVIGEKFNVDFGGDFLFELNFQTESKMTWTPLKGADRTSHTEQITMVEIRPNIYMIYWKEKSGNTIVHVEDFANGIAHTNIATPDGAFYNLNGPLYPAGKNNENVGKQNIPKTASAEDKIKVVGNAFKVDFGGDFIFKLDFHSSKSMTWNPLQGEDKTPHTESINMVEIRPNVYMVYWHEASGNRIVHVEDFANGKTFSNITLPDQTFYNLNGPMNVLELGLSNREKVAALLNSFNSGDSQPIAYINPDKYIQHNVNVADGLEGFGEIMKIKPPEGFKANIVRLFEDNEYVFAHTEYDFFGPKIGFDVFRFEKGKIVEHWDNLIPVRPPNPSGRTQTDGSSTVVDLEKTTENKEFVERFVTSILKNGEMDKLTNFIENGTENYIQHNPDIGDGLSGLGSALESMASKGIFMEYRTVHKILGEGNFVLAISEGSLGGKSTSFYDLFRISNGKIVEHWDVVESILPKEQWKNQNGKFNFIK